MTLQESPAAQAHLSVRAATPTDRDQLSELVYSAPHLHRHLDWRPPLDWIGQWPFLVLEADGRLLGVLACPRDPQPIAWIRLFSFGAPLSGQEAWHRLWRRARTELASGGGAMAAAIATQHWIEPLLVGDGFSRLDDIVVLSCDVRHVDPIASPSGVTIAAMTSGDLPAVAEVDAAAFDPLWRNSLDALGRAFLQASYAAVAWEGTRVLGYQLSTASPLGTHLARLAVRPEAQQRGLGAALVGDLIAHIGDSRASHLTVNTQARNAASLALYSRLNFELTGERYPVYAVDIPSPDDAPDGSSAAGNTPA
jgi:ribosomal protein S18 acetylase RimI-like enzyme